MSEIEAIFARVGHPGKPDFSSAADLARWIERVRWSAFFAGSRGDEITKAEVELLLPHIQEATRSQSERVSRLEEALKGLLAEWDKFTRYGSPMAKASNEAVTFARSALNQEADDGR